MDDLHYLPAHQLLAKLQSGELSSEQLTRLHLERIGQYNPAINAVVQQDTVRALKQAAEADQKRASGDSLGPLHGLPLTVKDTWEVTGLITAAGAPALKAYTPEHNADVVQRLQDAGAIILGKTNVPLFASDIQTYNKVYGFTRNPYNPDRTPGGSSGGAAAALACGLTPLEVGSDVGGSIRTPAHFCGVFGHKPTRDIISMRGHIPGPPGSLTQPDLAEAGPMARCSQDLELLLKVVAGPRPADARSWTLQMDPPAVSELAQARVGLWLDDPLCPIDSELRDGYRDLAGKLEQRGALVAKAQHPLLNLAHILPAYFNLLGSLMSPSLKASQRRQMKWVARLAPWLTFFGPVTHGIGEYGRGAIQPVYQWAVWNETREKMRHQIEELFDEFDVLLTPITPTAAIPHDHSQPMFKRRITVDGQQRSYMDQMCWIALATLLGLPATAVPIGRTQAGLPYSIQVIGAPGADLTTIRFGHLLEQAGLAGFTPPPQR
ncbi:amidase [Marinobacter salinisoli]|uniref:Amidase n=1 Tax=Marinobacter salinisoli TaxID=2769486 RepID=A0ABX7MQ21_9GAMM|nr:amidase [Marinobacter salinisoli]QSP94425.1 amidase [Marinobacter salinisoli]